MGPVLDYRTPERKSQWKLFWRLLPLFAPLFYWMAYIIVPVLVLGLALNAILFFQRRWLIAVVVFLFTPFSLLAYGSADSYFRGTAMIYNLHSANIDPGTRLRTYAPGVGWSGDWVHHGIQNGVLRVLIAVFGPVRGSYDGPYPDKPVAFATISGAKPFDLRQVSTDVITVDGQVINLRPGLGAQILSGFQQGPAADVSDPALLKQYGEAHATLVAGRCVVLEIPGQMPLVGKEHRVLILIDAVRGLAFANYYDPWYVHVYRMRIWR